jgi:hypothetical protein
VPIVAVTAPVVVAPLLGLCRPTADQNAQVSDAARESLGRSNRGRALVAALTTLNSAELWLRRGVHLVGVAAVEGAH